MSSIIASSRSKNGLDKDFVFVSINKTKLRERAILEARIEVVRGSRGKRLITLGATVKNSGRRLATSPAVEAKVLLLIGLRESGLLVKPWNNRSGASEADPHDLILNNTRVKSVRA